MFLPARCAAAHGSWIHTLSMLEMCQSWPLFIVSVWGWLVHDTLLKIGIRSLQGEVDKGVRGNESS